MDLGFKLRVLGFGFRDLGSGCRAQGLGFRDLGLGCILVQGSRVFSVLVLSV